MLLKGAGSLLRPWGRTGCGVKALCKVYDVLVLCAFLSLLV